MITIMNGMNTASLAPLLGLGERATYKVIHMYEQVYGRLPRHNRVIRVPAEAADRIREARDLVASGRAASYTDAFRLLKGGAVLTPDDRERIYHSLERLLEQAEALDPLLALVGYLREEVDILRSEIDQIRLVLYGAQMDQIARQDADIRKHLRPPRLLQATLAARDLQSQGGVSTPEPVETSEETPEETPGDTPKRSVWDLKWERWKRRMEKEEKEKNK